MPSGRWTLRLHGKSVTNGVVHAWIERDDASQSSFATEIRDENVTLGSISCGHKSIVVGSYSAHHLGSPLSLFSSAGPTRDGRHKPEISAPGQNVKAANSLSKTGVVAKSGTSMAAPAVCGVIALMLAEARANGHRLDIDQLRSCVIAATRPHHQSTSGWNNRYGFGMIDAAQAIASVFTGGQAVASITTHA